MWTIPKVLRPAFRRDRKLLGELCRSAWLSLRRYFRITLGSDTVPAAVFAIQTYGDQLNFHPHLHSLVAEGAWSRDDLTFQPIHGLDSDILTALFRQQVLERMVARHRLVGCRIIFRLDWFLARLLVSDNRWARAEPAYSRLYFLLGDHGFSRNDAVSKADLSTSPLFAGLPEDLLEECSRRARIINFPRGARLAREGEPAESFYLLASGSVEVVLEQAGEVDQLIDILGRGECVGDLALLLGRNRTATIRVLRDCRVASFAKRDFEWLLHNVPAFTVRLAATVGDRLESTTHRRVQAPPVEEIVALAVSPGAGIDEFCLELAQALRQEIDRRFKKAEFVPEISLNLAYLSPYNVEVVPRNVLVAGVTLTWDVFDWGRKRHELVNKNRVIEQARLALDEARAQVLTEVEYRHNRVR